MLLLAQDAEGTGSMTDTQVRDEAVTIFLAGHETTANALTWTWYLLAQNPEVEARFHQELDQVLAGRPPAVEDYPSLVYTERVLAESMRLYPPAWAVGRMAKEDFSIAGYVAPKGSILLMAPYSVQRDRQTDDATTWLSGQPREAVVGRTALRVAEASRATEEGEATRSGQGGVAVRVPLRGLQPAPYPETEGGVRVRPRKRLARAATRRPRGSAGTRPGVR